MENFTNPDVWEMDAATNNGVDNTVKIKEWAQFNTKRRKKILILDEAHRMSVQAFDALLKIIEEGVENVCFVFCTTEVDKIPDTVLSRTTKFKLFKLTTEETTQLANKICAKEGITIQDPAYFQHLVRKADGHGRDIIQYLNDAATLYSDEPGVITNHSIDLLCELYQSDRVEQFLVGCLNRDLDIMNQIIEESFLEPMGFCKTAIDLLRHEISLRTVLQGQETYKTYKSGDLIRLLGMIEDCKYRLLFGDSLTSLLIGWERWKLGQYIPMTDKEDLKRVI
jgi:DNA polymerase-3 subunit gamma/tau